MRIVLIVICVLSLSSCAALNTPPAPERENAIPPDANKITLTSDAHPVQSLSAEFTAPVPLPQTINTAGAEDSPFILPDGNTLYFFFTPDVRVPVEKQLFDQVTGIYVSYKQNETWTKPERVILQDAGKLSLDGCFFVLNERAWWCSAREGYDGLHWFTADNQNGRWRAWRNADKELKTAEYQTGELHISADGQELYFHSNRSGGHGGNDIWLSRQINGEWSEPINIDAVNSERDDGYPALNPAGDKLWFSRDYAIWRSRKVNGKWQTPEKIFSPLAGEASIDQDGNVYFVHHYFKDNVMLEADIYYAEKIH